MKLIINNSVLVIYDYMGALISQYYIILYIKFV